MTEQEWLTSADARAMLAHLGPVDRADQRKLRLFACACCRQLWDRLSPEGQALVETAERRADGHSTESSRTREALARANISDLSAAAAALTALEAPFTQERIDHFLTLVEQVAASAPGTFFQPSRWQEENRRRAELIREIFRNPFRPNALEAIRVPRASEAVRHLAEAIYLDCRFADLPILADALEEAGCTIESILDHCRFGGGHTRGCWVLDLLRTRD